MTKSAGQQILNIKDIITLINLEVIFWNLSINTLYTVNSAL